MERGVFYCIYRKKNHLNHKSRLVRVSTWMHRDVLVAAVQLRLCTWRHRDIPVHRPTSELRLCTWRHRAVPSCLCVFVRAAAVNAAL